MRFPQFMFQEQAVAGHSVAEWGACQGFFLAEVSSFSSGTIRVSMMHYIHLP
jgi:hypothetical protein